MSEEKPNAPKANPWRDGTTYHVTEQQSQDGKKGTGIYILHRNGQPALCPFIQPIPVVSAPKTIIKGNGNVQPEVEMRPTACSTQCAKATINVNVETEECRYTQMCGNTPVGFRLPMDNVKLAQKTETSQSEATRKGVEDRKKDNAGALTAGGRED